MGDTCGHDLHDLTEKLRYCPICHMVFAENAGVWVWEMCPHLATLAKLLVGDKGGKNRDAAIPG